MRIREVADLLGVEPYVLRHWEDMGVIRPPRAANGYRKYDQETVTRLRIVLACREAGLSLKQTRLVLHRNAHGREEVIRSQRDHIDRQLAELGSTRRFLEHVLTCQHSLMSRCPTCSAYAAT